MFFIGVAGGLGAFLYPTEAIGKNPFIFDVIRFYICHFTLVMVPLLSALFGIIDINIKKCWSIPLFFIFIEIVITINELILIKVGFVNSSWQDFFDRSIRNSSFIFGPMPSFDKIASIVTIFVPKVFTLDIFGINNGIDFYWPVVWLIIPSFIYLPVIDLVEIGYYKLNKLVLEKVFKKKERQDEQENY